MFHCSTAVTNLRQYCSAAAALSTWFAMTRMCNALSVFGCDAHPRRGELVRRFYFRPARRGPVVNTFSLCVSPARPHQFVPKPCAVHLPIHGHLDACTQFLLSTRSGFNPHDCFAPSPVCTAATSEHAQASQQTEPVHALSAAVPTASVQHTTEHTDAWHVYACPHQLPCLLPAGAALQQASITHLYSHNIVNGQSHSAGNHTYTHS